MADNHLDFGKQHMGVEAKDLGTGKWCLLYTEHCRDKTTLGFFIISFSYRLNIWDGRFDSASTGYTTGASQQGIYWQPENLQLLRQTSKGPAPGLGSRISHADSSPGRCILHLAFWDSHHSWRWFYFPRRLISFSFISKADPGGVSSSLAFSCSFCLHRKRLLQESILRISKARAYGVW